MPRTLLATLLLTAAAGPAVADAESDKQKATALANMKKAEITGATAAESEHLIVCAALPEAKTKAMAMALEKVYALARKALKYEPTDKPFTGKLTVYYLPDRQYKQYMRLVLSGRAEDTAHFVLKGDEPFVAVSPDLPAKSPDADVIGEVGVAVAAAVFSAKSSTEYPDWVRTGFARATALRAEGTGSRRYLAYKAQAKSLALGGKGKPPAPIADVWGGRTKESEVLATSLVDFLAYGPGAAKFEDFLRGLAPSENVPMPTATQAIEAAGWKEPQLEALWKKWVLTGR